MMEATLEEFVEKVQSDGYEQNILYICMKYLKNN